MDIRSAIKRGDVVQVRRYLESGVEANLANRNGASLLMYAALHGNTAIGTELITHGASLDLRDKHGWTALALAVHSGHPSFVELLCRSGASLDGHPFGSSFESFLDWASQYGTGSEAAMAKTRSIIQLTREARFTIESAEPLA